MRTREQTVVHFAGGGGSCTGIEQALGFSPDHATFYDPRTGETTTRPLTKEEQIRMCGNSVCPPVAAALVRKNCPEMAIRTASRWQQPQAERRAA
jgi:site-specific DNA-cytosine methylase